MNLKVLDTGKIPSEEYFINAYLEEVFESENVYTSTKRSRIILYTNNEIHI